MALPAFVTVGAVGQSASAATITPALPASRVNNNILLAYCTVFGTGKVITTATTGWTVVDSINTNVMSAAWAWRLVDGTETAAVWTWTGAAPCAGYEIQYSGNATVSPINANNKASADTSFTPTVAALTTTADNCLILDFVCCSSGGVTIGLADGFTSRSTASVNSGAIRLSDAPKNVTGTTSAQTMSFINPASLSWQTFGIALLGSGAGTVDNERATQTVQEVLETNVATDAARATQTVQEVLETNVATDAARVTQTVVQVLRSISFTGTYVQRWQAGAGVGLTWTNAFTTTTLNSIANGNAILSDVSIINGTPLDLYMDISAALASAAFTGTDPNIQFFLYPLNQNGIYGDGGFVVSSAGPVPGNYWCAKMALVSATQAQTGTMSSIRLPPGTFKLVLANYGGVTLASSGNVCQYRTYDRQIG